MPSLSVPSLSQNEFTARHFGGNILASRDELNAGTGFEHLVDELGVTSLRYPGGSLTEHYFDISNPDADIVVDLNGATQSFVPLSDFIDFAAEQGLSAVIVLPTQTNLSAARDANGDRFAQIDEAELRGFVNDVVSGVYGDVRIDAFELGNEYWGSGQMSSVEYGRVASQMARIVNDELERLSVDHPEAEFVDIIVQTGTNFDHARLSDEYSGLSSGQEILEALSEDYGVDFPADTIWASGRVDWTAVANRLIMSEFDTQDEIDAIDGLVSHQYSRGDAAPGQRDFLIRSALDTWQDIVADPDYYVTEWNQSTDRGVFDTREDYGLLQAHEMLHTLEAMLNLGVDQAQVWPLLQNTPNAMSTGFSHQELTPGGEMFRLMSETLPGKVMLDFQPDDREVDLELANASVHGFYGDGELAFFVASTGDQVSTTQVDLSQLMTAPGAIRVDVLGVADGANPGDTRSDAVVEEIPADDVFENGVLTATLAPGEILRITFTDFTPTETFEDTIAEQIAPDESVAFLGSAESYFSLASEAAASFAPLPEASSQERFLGESEFSGAQDDAEAEDAEYLEDDPIAGDEDDDGGILGGLGLMLLPLLLLALL